MQYLKYKGEFLSRNNTIIGVEIYREADTAYGQVEMLRFPGEDSVVIEWDRTDKEEAICGSTAEVTIISPGDRTYEDLYTITPGDITLKIFRNGLLYWSGTLDPEFYEEPYSAGSDYDVTLTFSDFGILNRLKFNLSGMLSMCRILGDALRRARLDHCPVSQDLSTCIARSETPVTLEGLSLRADNFYDEDGEALSMYEVLEGMLQPLAMRIVQQAGRLYVYDLNALYLHARIEPVRWESDDQVMGTDKVGNNVKITFSPYSDAELLNGDIEYEGDQSGQIGEQPDGSASYHYYTNYKIPEDYNRDNSYISFLIYVGGKAASEYTSSYDRFFEISPMLGGSKGTGMAYFFYTGGHGSLSSGMPKPVGSSPSTKSDLPVIKSGRIYLPSMNASEARNTLLRLQLETLIDARYNPFTNADGDNESRNYDTLLGKMQYMYIPFRAVVYDEDGNVLCHYVNQYETTKTYLEPHMKYTTGKWVDGPPEAWDEAVLAYYNTDDPGGSLQTLGWRTNRQTLKRNRKFIKRRPSWLKIDDGQYMIYPTVSGYLEISILTGINTYKTRMYSAGEEKNDLVFSTDPTPYIRWMLYKMPKLSVVKGNSIFEEYNSDDVEYTGVLNENAKDDIEIDTICGTMKEANPAARGVYHATLTGLQVTEMTRAGRTTQVEQLMIGTLYSQYADRKTVLSGTAKLAEGDLCLYTDANQGDKRFIILQDVQNLIADERELEMVELRPDEYDSDKK